MDREELKASIKKAYEKGYHEGFADVCDIITPALTEATIIIRYIETPIFKVKVNNAKKKVSRGKKAYCTND